MVRRMVIFISLFLVLFVLSLVAVHITVTAVMADFKMPVESSYTSLKVDDTLQYTGNPAVEYQKPITARLYVKDVVNADQGSIKLIQPAFNIVAL